VPGRYLVHFRIRNNQNVEDKVGDISLRRRDHIKLDVVWAVLRKMFQSIEIFGLIDRLEIYLDHAR